LFLFMPQVPPTAASLKNEVSRSLKSGDYRPCKDRQDDGEIDNIQRILADHRGDCTSGLRPTIDRITQPNGENIQRTGSPTTTRNDSTTAKPASAMPT
jgi:hypothetical protein